jgi:hypothetical protein
VLVNVEVRVVDPSRLPHRHRCDPLSEAGCVVDAGQDPVPEQIRVEHFAARREFEHRAPADVHVGTLGLQAKEGGVERGQPALHHVMIRSADRFRIVRLSKSSDG